MIKKLLILPLSLTLTFITSLQIALALSPLSLSVLPEHIFQGSPLFIALNGTTTTNDIKSISFGKKSLPLFLYQESPRAFYGIDLKKSPGTYTITAILNDETILSKDIQVEALKKDEATLGIPAKLGGNTTQSQKKLVDTSALENANLSRLPTFSTALWKEPFYYPVANPVVTDVYGYVRKTGIYTIAHKGTDFRAGTGTKVFAMNRGIVRIAKSYRNYGKTVVIDHGNGLMTLYMHLSKIQVSSGELVERGQTIALSGKTGYAENPHLHLSIRINDISIDPEKFMHLFQ